jgi:hypothetical protein
MVKAGYQVRDMEQSVSVGDESWCLQHMPKTLGLLGPLFFIGLLGDSAIEGRIHRDRAEMLRVEMEPEPSG